MPVKAIDLSALAAKTENYTGADLKNLCREVFNLHLVSKAI
jgi:SpoVK/Ycf46/Vps4 family AAA+-type ATPase